MIVNAPVINRETGEKTTAKFMVEFAHSKPKCGKHRRTCMCRIYVCSSDTADNVKNKYPDNNIEECISDKHPDTKSRMLMVESMAQSTMNDNYVKAYGRMLSMQRGLRYMMDKFYDSDSIIAICNKNPYTFTNETYKAFAHQLNIECNAGRLIAEKLQHTPNYNPYDEKAYHK